MEHITFEEYWQEVGRLLGSEDTVTVVDGDAYDDWEGDEIVEFRDSCGCLISRYNKDKELVERG